MNSINNKLKKLFDFQRIENNEKLQNVIDEVNTSGPKVRMLSDDELMMAAGGSEIDPIIVSETNTNQCGKCGSTLIKKQGKKYCMKCHAFVDDNNNPITDGVRV